jgi:hypothetical protein
MMAGTREELHEVRAKVAFLTHAAKAWLDRTEAVIGPRGISPIVLEGRYLFLAEINESLAEIEASIDREEQQNEEVEESGKVSVIRPA